ncbi:MAG: methylmalonate-semialdehyde dehydrogenase (CoA acylating) [Gammaproteobacteria bacterium]|nr:MAG: methylmalonate-semialdehyde dehydrogenase (CoA acylating) [Gammaproteobacteria bacterium]
MSKIQNFINGKLVDAEASEYTPVYNPATGQPIAQCPMTTVAQVDEAVKGADNAFKSWSQTPVIQRTQVMFKLRELLLENLDELATMLSTEHGKTHADAKAEIGRGIEVVEFACGMPHHLKGDISVELAKGVDAFNIRQPLGVCAGITPFNFPGMIPLWMAPIAIAAGNTFVLKPAEADPSLPLRIAVLWQQAGLPDGVLQVVNGGKTVVERFIEHPDIAAISFVGSSKVAEIVYQGGTAHGKRVQALGAAKNHAIVMPDADLAFTVNHIVGAAFGAAGERCMALPQVVCIGDSVADKLVAMVKAKMQDLHVGAYDDEKADLGPLYSKSHQQKVNEYIHIGVEEDQAELIVDGRHLTVPGYENGFFVGPTLFDHVKEGMVIHNDEIFGPVLGVMRVSSYDDAVAVINRHPFGNGAVIFTTNGGIARQFVLDIKAGMVGINVPIPAPSALYSFGGWKSSIFAEHHMYGEEGVRFFTRFKVTTARWPDSASGSQSALVMPT